MGGQTRTHVGGSVSSVPTVTQGNGHAAAGMDISTCNDTAATANAKARLSTE